MATTTLTVLQTRVRQKADMVGSNFVTDAELVTIINAGWQELYDLLVAADAADYFTTSTTFTMTSAASIGVGAGGIGVTNLYKVRGVEYQGGGGGTGYDELLRCNWANRNRMTSRAYCLLGSTLYVFPPELAAGSYRLWYVPQPTLLSGSTDTIETYNGWDEYVVTDAAIKCLLKEESDAGALMAQKEALRQRIMDMVERDQSGPALVSDVQAWIPGV